MYYYDCVLRKQKTLCTEHTLLAVYDDAPRFFFYVYGETLAFGKLEEDMKNPFCERAGVVLIILAHMLGWTENLTIKYCKRVRDETLPKHAMVAVLVGFRSNTAQLGRNNGQRNGVTIYDINRGPEW